MYEWSKSSEVSWIRIGEVLVNLRNVNTVSKCGEGCRISFEGGQITELPGTPVREVAELIGFKAVEDADSTA